MSGAQKTQSVLLSFKYENGQNFPSLRVMLRKKGHAQPFYIVGSCSEEEHANRDSRAIASMPLPRRRQGSIATPYLLLFRRRKRAAIS